MTKLVQALNLEELQDKLDRLMNDDEEDRPWYLHGVPAREEGYWYQMLTDENPTIRVHSFDLASALRLVKEIYDFAQDHPDPNPSTSPPNPRRGAGH